MRTRLAALENTNRTQIYKTATRPATVNEGTIIFVSDAAAGSKFQGWDGSSWVSLG